MKTYTTAALFAAASVCAIAPAGAATLEQYVAAANEALDLMNGITSLLNGVNDKASADAAAPKLLAMGNKLMELQAKQASFGEPSKEVRQQIVDAIPEFEAKSEAAVGAFIEAMQGLFEDAENPCYGSDALLQAIMMMMQM